MLTATVTVNLDIVESGYFQELDRDDRHALDHLDAIPIGARLVVQVGNRQILSPSAIAILARHERRLHVEIDAASPYVARRWYDAITAGEVV